MSARRRRTGGSEPDADAPRPSRSQQTRDARAVGALGIHLTTLSPDDLDRLELPERLRREIAVSQELNPRSRGRQNRLIGQLLRAEDHEAIRERVDRLAAAARDGVRQEKMNERWLARLVEEGDTALDELVSSHPGADRQRLRTLLRSARQDAAATKAKRARRELLRAIRTLRA